MQNTSTIFMVKPVAFGFNEETALNNAFQNKNTDKENLQEKALEEFNGMTKVLQENGIKLLVFEDTKNPHTPDSIFPNNWISTHENGQIFLYPMQAENRRPERRNDFVETFKKEFSVAEVTDLSHFESLNIFLEGTGSMVLDRDHKIAYACLSSRTNPDVLHEFCTLAGYTPVTFHAVDQNNHEIYHTNVMMCVAEKFVVISFDTIPNPEEKEQVRFIINSSGKEIIEISMEQINNFAGNMLELKNQTGQSILVMSQRAKESLTKAQTETLSGYSKIVSAPLTTIENNGGGSARCMIAEIHLPYQKN